jgi:glycosyltransferase 2 family protein
MNEQPSSGPQPRVGRQTLLWTLKIVVSGGLLAVLLTRVDLARLWEVSRTASLGWLAAALLVYFVGVVISVWRWGLLLDAQHVTIQFATRLKSYLVATFFNNFLPSNIGGDVIRIRDTAGAAGSKTLAATVVLVDRGLGLLGVVFVAATGATLAARMSAAIGPMAPGLLWGVLALAIVLAAPVLLLPHGIGKLLRPLRAIHQEWVEERIERLTSALARFRDQPKALAACFAGAIVVQGLIVGFYWAIAAALNLQVPLAHLAIVVPMSLVVQMLPMSVNGFGVREATFGFYFTQLGQPLESALALSFIGAALIMIFSTSGVPFLLQRRRSASA